MSVLITGGVGFVGMNLTEELTSRGETVVLFDRGPLPACVAAALKLTSPRPIFVEGDVTKADGLITVLDRHRCARIVHLAAITAGPVCEAEAPEAIVAVNVVGTVNVLRAAKLTGATKVVYVGSGSAYGSAWYEGGLLQEETSPSKPESLYGITKLAAEQAALRLAAIWGINLAAVRLGSVCGPWERPTGARERMSPYLQLARMALRGETAVLPADEVRRDWIYSRDVAAGLAALLSSPAAQGLMHLSSGIEWHHPLMTWCDVLASAYPAFCWRTVKPGEHANIDMIDHRDRSLMSIERLVGATGFKIMFSSEAASVDYLTWIKNHESALVSS